MSITINGLECVELECEHCGANFGLLKVTNLSDGRVICLYCIKNKTDKELGIEPMDKGEE